MDCHVCGEMRSAGGGLGNDNKKPKLKSEVLSLCPGKPLYTTENLVTYVTHDLTHKLLQFTGVTIKVRLPMKYQITAPSHCFSKALGTQSIIHLCGNFYRYTHTRTHTQNHVLLISDVKNRQGIRKSKEPSYQRILNQLIQGYGRYHKALVTAVK